jgi:1-deoxy-D-xylulose-5-phosphate synthase
MKEKIERIDIKSIKDPSVVKRLGYRSLALLCHDIRKEIIEETSTYGGHLASNLGVVELTVALYRCFDFPKDKLIFDVGHQCYTHKILTGRSLDHLRQKGGPSGFERRSESVYDCYEAGHSGTSLSAAEGFAIARDLRKEDYNIVALVGDASIVNGLSFEALNNLGSRHDKVIVVLNDNDMSISRPVGGLGNFFRKISTSRFYNKWKSSFRRRMYRTKIGHGIYSFTYFLKSEVKAALVPTTMFDNMGFTYIGPVDGHNIKDLEKAFKQAKNATKSVVIHVYTTKGKGYPKAENDSSGYWHGVTPFEIDTGDAKVLHPGEISWSHYFGAMTNEYLGKNKDTVLICPAMIKGSHLEEAFQNYPERCFDVGIAEEHALTLAGALSLNGFHPIVSIYSTFLQRAYDELLHDCARLNADMTLLIDRAGFVGADGSTHMGIYDEAFLKSIPNVIVSMPSTFAEARYLYEESLKKGHGVMAIRYPHTLSSEFTPIPSLKLSFLKWRFLNAPKAGKPAVIAVGPNGLQFIDQLKEKGFEGTFVNPLFLNPIDSESLDQILSASLIYIYDSYGTKTGFAESVLSALAEKRFSGIVKVKAIPSSFIPHGSIHQQEKDFGVSIDDALEDLLSL